MKKDLLPLLSDSLRGLFLSIASKHKNKILEEIRTADALIEIYNSEKTRISIDDIYLIGALKTLKESIDNLLTEEARMLSYRAQTFEFSYLPKGKEPVYTSDNHWGRQNRQSAKPSRLIQKLLKQKHSCAEYEEFNNLVKAEIMNAGKFVLVSKGDITKYYNSKTYYKDSGMLGNSCMRHDECSKYFEIYEDHAQLLICKKDNRITGRALVWNIDGYTILDRIYCCEDYITEQFTEYAKDHKWVIREDNSLLYDGDEVRWLFPEDNYTTPTYKQLYIQLDKVYEYMPYLDTFRYYDRDTNVISNDACNGHICLSQTNGAYLGVTYTCPICGQSFTVYGEDADDDPTLYPPEGMVYSELDDTLYCEDCAIYCDGSNEYVGPEHEIVQVKFKSHRRETALIYPIERIKDKIQNKEVAEIGGIYYLVESYPNLQYNPITDEWINTKTGDERNTLRSTATRRSRRSL